MLRATFSQPPRRSLRATLSVVVVVVEVIDYQRRIIKRRRVPREPRKRARRSKGHVWDDAKTSRVSHAHVSACAGVEVTQTGSIELINCERSLQIKN